jgi:hypothetical protein
MHYSPSVPGTSLPEETGTNEGAIPSPTRLCKIITILQGLQPFFWLSDWVAEDVRSMVHTELSLPPHAFRKHTEMLSSQAVRKAHGLGQQTSSPSSHSTVTLPTFSHGNHRPTTLTWKGAENKWLVEDGVNSLWEPDELSEHRNALLKWKRSLLHSSRPG